MENKEENKNTVLKTIEQDLVNLKKYIDSGEHTIKEISEYVSEILECDPFGYCKADCSECKYHCYTPATHWDPPEWNCAFEGDDDFTENYFETKESEFCKHFGTPDPYEGEY